MDNENEMYLKSQNPTKKKNLWSDYILKIEKNILFEQKSSLKVLQNDLRVFKFDDRFKRNKICHSCFLCDKIEFFQN